MYCWKNEMYVLLYVGTCKINDIEIKHYHYNKNRNRCIGMSVNNLQMAITQIELLDTNHSILLTGFKNGLTDSLPEVNIASL